MQEQSFEDVRLREKSHLLKESGGDNTGRESAGESTSTNTSASGDASLRVEATLTDMVLHKSEF